MPQEGKSLYWDSFNHGRRKPGSKLVISRDKQQTAIHQSVKRKPGQSSKTSSKSNTRTFTGKERSIRRSSEQAMTSGATAEITSGPSTYVPLSTASTSSQGNYMALLINSLLPIFLKTHLKLQGSQGPSPSPGASYLSPEQSQETAAEIPDWARHILFPANESQTQAQESSSQNIFIGRLDEVSFTDNCSNSYFLTLLFTFP